MAKTNPNPKVNTLVLDIGNSEIKAEVNGRRFTLPSNYQQVCGRDYLKLSDIEAPFYGFSVSDLSDPTEVQNTFSPLGGRNLLGDGDKLLMYKSIIQGCCGGIKTEAPWDVVVSYWKPEKLNTLKVLEGAHTVMVNGRDNEFNIRRLLAVAEGAGAHALYRKDAAGTFVSVDIGYDTLIFRSSSEHGVLNHEPIENSGVSQIVEYLQTSKALTQRAGAGITDRAIIDAIKNQGVLRNNQQQVPDVDISDLISAATKFWFQGSFLKIVRRYKADVNQASAIWLIGGGANLLREFTRGTNIYVPEEPGLVNLQGMSSLL